ncbi:MAG: vWA domain-containing protein [Persicimonas sp.]
MNSMMCRSLGAAGLVLTLLTVPACLEHSEIDVHVSGIGSDSETATRRAALSALDSSGKPIPLTASNTTVTVQTRQNGGPWSSATAVQLDFSGPAHIDTVLVSDNSGSLETELAQMKAALKSFTHLLLNGNGRDRVGLVRVSTVSTLEQTLTDDEAEIDAAVDDLFITNGWTAFYDGVRLANEALDDGAAAQAGQSGSSYCVDEAYRAIVAFTDGDDNHSEGQHSTDSPDDGVATKLEDLYDLQVNNVATPIYTVGIGNKLDATVLQDLSAQTGGTYRDIASYRQLKGALTSTANQLESSAAICFEAAACQDNEAKLRVEVTHQGQTAVEEFIVDLAPAGCTQ